MKTKLSFITQGIAAWAAALAMLSLAGCSADGPEKVTDDSTVTFAFSVDGKVGSRAFGDVVKANQITYAIYKKGTTTPEKWAKVSLAENLNVSLSKGTEYEVVFWADAQEASCFAFDENAATITVDYSKMESNSEEGDAFFAYKAFTAAAGSTVSVRLTRPFAQMNIGSSDFKAAQDDGIDTAKIATELVIKNVPTVLSLKDGKTNTTQDVTFTTDGVPQESFPIPGYSYLAMHYVLCSDESSLQQPITVAVKEGSKEHARVEIENLSLKRNYRTNIMGAFLTGSTNFDITIDQGFGGSDGPSIGLKSHTEADGTVIYEIGSAEDLALLQKKATDASFWTNSGLQFTGDINLTGVWTPINVQGTADKHVQIDGNGKTVSGFTFDANKSEQGLFGTAQYVDIKDLTVANVKYEDKTNNSSNIGAVAGKLTGTISNVEVRDCDILVDNGTNIGGVVGQMITTGETTTAGKNNDKTVEEVFATVTVDNCRILGSTAVGGFTGCLSNDGNSRAGGSNVFVKKSGIIGSSVMARQGSTPSTGAPSRAGNAEAGLVAGSVMAANTKVYYDEFVNQNNTTTDFIGTDNDLWEQIDGETPSTPGGDYKYAGGTYEIWSLEHLQRAITECESRKEDATIKLMGDINCGNAQVNSITITTGWGDKTVIFDGDGHKISNAIFGATDIIPTGGTGIKDAQSGLFIVTGQPTVGESIVKGLNVQNLKFEDITISYNGTRTLSAGVVAAIYSGTISGVEVTNLKIENKPSGYGHLGGIVGRIITITSNLSCTIKDCTVKNMSNTNCEAVGGIVGYADAYGPHDNSSITATHILTGNTVENCTFTAPKVTNAGFVAGTYTGSRPPETMNSTGSNNWVNGKKLEKAVGDKY